MPSRFFKLFRYVQLPFKNISAWKLSLFFSSRFGPWKYIVRHWWQTSVLTECVHVLPSYCNTSEVMHVEFVRTADGWGHGRPSCLPSWPCATLGARACIGMWGAPLCCEPAHMTCEPELEGLGDCWSSGARGLLGWRPTLDAVLSTEESGLVWGRVCCAWPCSEWSATACSGASRSSRWHVTARWGRRQASSQGLTGVLLQMR